MGEKTASAKGVLESFGLKDKLKTVSIDLSTGWKFISARAKHEAKTFNKKARKALATYEEGSSVRYDQVYNCDFDVGFSVWKRFQGSWREMREESDKNTCLAEGADVIINDVFKEWQKWESTVSQFHENLVAIPDIIAQVEIAQAQLAKIGDQISKVEKLLVEHEDVVMKVELERKKCNEKLELSKLVEKRQKAYQEMKAKYEMTEEESGEMAMVLERQESIEKQQVYEDAFLEQMEKYIRYGELELANGFLMHAEIQFYALATTDSEKVIENFYKAAKSAKEIKKGDDIVLSIGGFTAHIGNGEEDEVVAEWK
ncbi:dysbindin-like isoform X3 [Rhopilema esculentum]|uniref:dysbindin-like isoform X3 n=1 Tax=Rhopilema esculentum TaxID=499914 RepID=UPI0031DADC74|eukprot:gene1060-15390_t